MKYFYQQMKQEWRFMCRQKYILLLLACTLLVSGFAVVSGLSEVKQQQKTIEYLKTADLADRSKVQAKYDDAGYLAYYSFHLTYSPPSDIAFAALGERDIYPWKHRIRMLALEGQIYESDTQNAELAAIGSFDFTFVISALAPLLAILLFHDLFANERTSGRYNLLVVTAKSPRVFWAARSLVRFVSLFVCLMLPFYLGAIVSNTQVIDVVLISLVTVLYLFFWSGLSLWHGRKSNSAPNVISQLIGFWVLVAFIIPILGDLVINKTVYSPKGGDIVLTQREAVNDAWDLPKENTMNAFINTHPKWANYVETKNTFEWKWYYAFQQVGDQVAEPLAIQYQAAANLKYQLAGYVSLMSPPLLIQRYFARMAKTDAPAAIEYEEKIRVFHQQLRLFYYPFLFTDNYIDNQQLTNIPSFEDIIYQ